jgi:hypothetical protein
MEKEECKKNVRAHHNKNFWPCFFFDFFEREERKREDGFLMVERELLIFLKYKVIIYCRLLLIAVLI